MRFRVTFAVDWRELPALIQATEAYDAPEVEVLPEPKATKSKPKKRERKPVSETGLGKLILGLLADGRAWTVKEMEPHLKADGYSPASALGTCSNLLQEGKVDRPEKGVYILAGSTSVQAAA